jgi:HEAT repeat protein
MAAKEDLSDDYRAPRMSKPPRLWLVCLRDLAFCTLICFALITFWGGGIGGLATVCAGIAIACACQQRAAKATKRAQCAAVDLGPRFDGALALRQPRRFQFRMRHLMILVAGCAIAFGIRQALYDKFNPASAPARGLYALRSSNPGTRAWGAQQITFTLMFGSPALMPGQLAALVDGLLGVVHDDDATVREAAAGALLQVVIQSENRSELVPRAEKIAAAMAGVLGDGAPQVRSNAAFALALIYSSRSSTTLQPLPEDSGPLTEALARALGDPDSKVRNWACRVLSAIGRRIGGPPPPALIAALDAPSAATRSKAAEAAAAFSTGPDKSVGPRLLGSSR